MPTTTFPQSDVPLDATPDSTWVTCGSCGRTFPDLYPAARCPFEADHVAPSSDIYERRERIAAGEKVGPIWADLDGMSISEMEDYFLDDDPAAYL